MKRCYGVTVLIVSLTSLTACGGVLTGASAPVAPARAASGLYSEDACGAYGGLAPHFKETSARHSSDVIYTFSGSPDGAHPCGGLVAGKNGEYYGTTAYGGSNGDGSVYEVTAAGKENVLYSFGAAPDGVNPYAPLIIDKHGALYGDTFYGGAYNHGTVFKLTPGKQGWTESVLYSFQGGDDGAYPLGRLLITSSGTLIGTTYMGGTQESGVVFELAPSGSTYEETVICSFGSSCNTGLNPADGLVSDSSGNLYGTTTDGGYCGCGTIFKLTPSGSRYIPSTIYYFKGGPMGRNPTAGLLIGSHGVLYGTTNRTDSGRVFALTPNGSQYTYSVIYRFTGGSDGRGPDDRPGLVADRNGNLYGTTVEGGGSGCLGGCGTVFELSRSGKKFSEHVLYAFQGGTDGAEPFGGVIIGRKGALLGTTNLGGASRSGTIFSICCAPFTGK